MLQRSLAEHQHASAAKTIILKPCDDPGLAAVHARRHSILARPTDARVAYEMWSRGMEHAQCVADAHAEDLQPYLYPSSFSRSNGGGSGSSSGGGGGTDGVISGSGIMSSSGIIGSSSGSSDNSSLLMRNVNGVELSRKSCAGAQSVISKDTFASPRASYSRLDD